HRMRRGRQLLQRRLDRGGDAAQRLQLAPVGGQLGGVGQLAVHQQVRDLLELGRGGQVEDVVAAIGQVVAAAADRAQRGVAGGGAGQCDRLLRLERRGGGGVAHGWSPGLRVAYRVVHVRLRADAALVGSKRRSRRAGTRRRLPAGGRAP